MHNVTKAALFDELEKIAGHLDRTSRTGRRPICVETLLANSASSKLRPSHLTKRAFDLSGFPPQAILQNSTPPPPQDSVGTANAKQLHEATEALRTELNLLKTSGKAEDAWGTTKSLVGHMGAGMGGAKMLMDLTSLGDKENLAKLHRSGNPDIAKRRIHQAGAALGALEFARKKVRDSDQMHKLVSKLRPQRDEAVEQLQDLNKQSSPGVVSPGRQLANTRQVGVPKVQGTFRNAARMPMQPA